METAHKTADEIRVAMDAFDRNVAKSSVGSNRPIHTPPRPSLPQVASVEGSDEALLAAVGRGSSRRNGRRGATARSQPQRNGPRTPGAANTRQATDTHTPGARCAWCNYDGHTQAQCRKRMFALGQRAASAQPTHATSDWDTSAAAILAQEHAGNDL